MDSTDEYDGERPAATGEPTRALPEHDNHDDLDPFDDLDLDDPDRLDVLTSGPRVERRWIGSDGRDRFLVDLGRGPRTYRSVPVDSESLSWQERGL